MLGKCRICGKEKKLTFEHIPPKKAFNSTPVYFQNFEHLHESESPIYGKRIRSNNGAGGYFLCKSCNNNTGSWYASDYVEFAKLGAYVLTNRVYANKFICAEYPIKPLNVLKQVFTMFAALDSSDYLIEQKGYKEFILDPKSKDIPPNIRVFMYFTSSIKTRNPISFSNMEGYNRRFGEISFIPFGFHISIDTLPINRPFCEITSFATYDFNEREKMILPLQYLIPKTMFPGMYL